MNLSDNDDDFDSFFSGIKTAQKKSAVSAKPPDIMDDLFGITNKKGRESKNSKKKHLFVTAQDGSGDSTMNIFEDTDSDDLGFDPKQIKRVTKSQNLFDDLLKSASSSIGKKTQPGNPLMTRQSTETTTGIETSNVLQNSSTAFPRPKTSKGRINSEMSSMFNPDPLGIFTKENVQEASNTIQDTGDISSSKQNKQKPKTAEWLGLTSETDITSFKIDKDIESTSFEELPKATSSPRDQSKMKVTGNDFVDESINVSALGVSNEIQMPDVSNKQSSSAVYPPPLDPMAQNILLLGTLNKDAEQSFAALKYQEHHLIMAQQMKQQEKNLMDMQRKQELLLQRQEKQFHALLQQQLQRHQKLEEILTQQQQRLNNHLQMMMITANQTINETILPLDLDLGQITTSTTKGPTLAQSEIQGVTIDEERNANVNEDNEETEMKVNEIQIRADCKRLELENSRLEELLANTKNNYEKEIELLEKSHQKQIEVLDQQFRCMENRLTKELENVENYYKERLNVVKGENENARREYDNQIVDLKQEHEDEIRKIRRNQQDDLESMREEHKRMLDAIRQSKMLEFAVIQESGTNLESLKIAADNLTNLTDGLEELRANLRHKIDIEQMDRQKQLEKREKHLIDAEKRLQLSEEMANDEKKRLIDLVAKLESEIMKRSQESSEEKWQLQQKLATLEAEKLSFNREKEYFREQMQKDEQRIKDLKEIQLIEGQKLQMEIQEERARLQVERSAFEMEKRMRKNDDHENKRLELDAALQVAQDTTCKADMERERYQKLQRQLEQSKKDLNDRECALSVKEDQLQQELLAHRVAERLALETQQKSRLAEQHFNNKIHLVEQKLQELTERETYLSQERLLLTQDRNALNALKMKITQQTKCTLCQLTQKQHEISDALESNLKSLYHNDLILNDNNTDKKTNNIYQNNHNKNILNAAASIMDNKVDSFLTRTSFMNQLQNTNNKNNETNFMNSNSNNNDHNDIVDRILDADIAESLRKMYNTTKNLGHLGTHLYDGDHNQRTERINE